MKREPKSIVFEKLDRTKKRVLKNSIRSIEKQPVMLSNNETDLVVWLKNDSFFIIKGEYKKNV